MTKKTKDEIFQEVGDYLKDQKAYGGEVTRDTTIQDAGLDSLDTAEMVMDLEAQYGISIPENEAVKMENVGIIVDTIHGLLEAKGE